MARLRLENELLRRRLEELLQQLERYAAQVAEDEQAPRGPHPGRWLRGGGVPWEGLCGHLQSKAGKVHTFWGPSFEGTLLAAVGVF